MHYKAKDFVNGIHFSANIMQGLNMSDLSSNKLQFIRDLPADQDLFDDSHKRIASAITNVIKHGYNIRTIGLLGPWGSGKSTIINMVSSSLDSDKITFIYDAWVHQSDPHRRSFLESMISFLERRGILVSDEWKGELERLSRRSETHITENTPILTTWGVLITFSLLLLPLGYKIFTKENWNSPWSILIILPVIIALINYLCWRPKYTDLRKQSSRWESLKSWLSTNKAPYENRSIVGLFINKTVDRVTNRIIKTPDPTITEFDEIFKKILHAIDNKNKRLIVVIDNLDRIPTCEALVIWSTFRSFFYSSNDAEEEYNALLPHVVLRRTHV